MTSRSETPHLVIFDCDGVLIDSERLAVRFDAQLFGEFGWEVTEQFIVDRYVGRSYAFMIGELDDRVGPLPDDFRERYDRGLHALFEAELRTTPGLVEALDAIEAAGVRTCVASSSTHERLRFSLGLTGLYDRFAGRIFSRDDVERGKPEPDLFLHAASVMGYAPDQCAVIEDSEFGTQAARAADMRAYGFLGGLLSPDRLEGPGTVLFDDMRKLLGLLGL